MVLRRFFVRNADITIDQSVTYEPRIRGRPDVRLQTPMPAPDRGPGQEDWLDAERIAQLLP